MTPRPAMMNDLDSASTGTLEGSPPAPARRPAAAPRVSVVVPVYNEQDNLRPLHDEIAAVLESMREPFEVVYVDDGSTDGSAAVLHALRASDARARVLRLRRNAGQSAAMAAGFAAARGEIIVTLDADLQNDPGDIPRLLRPLDDCEAVVGWRRLRSDSWLRRISSRTANAIRNLLSGEDIIDTGCSLKAYRRDALSRVKMFDGMHRFLPTLLRLEGCRVRQIDVAHRTRLHGRSKYNVHNRLVRSFVDLLVIVWMKRRTLRYRVTEVE